MDEKMKHMEMIQNVISRMAGNSFLVKGWCVTLVAALFALGAKDLNVFLACVALLPVIMFWGLDAYFLRQERLFRKLYDNVRNLEPQKVNFSMNTQPFASEVNSVIQVAFSPTLVPFYSVITLMVVVVIFLVAFGLLR